MAKRMFGPNVSIQLSEDFASAVEGKPQELLRVGAFKHPKYGIVQITKDIMFSFVKNFKDNAKRVKLAVDFGHDAGGKAAAWFKDVHFDEKSGVLNVIPKWTPGGKDAVKNEDYLYLSVDFDLEYEDNESGKKFGPTLNGAGLTNRPFIKGMESIQLSEGDIMNLEQALAMIEQLKAQLAQAQQPAAAPGAPNPLQAQLGEMQKKQDEQQKLFSEAQARIKKYEDADAARAIEDAKAAKNKQFDELMKDGKACEAQRVHFLSGDSLKFAEAFVAPKLERVSHDDKGADKATADSAEGKILQFADALLKEGKAKDQMSAICMVLSDPQHKAVSDEYNKHVQL